MFRMAARVKKGVYNLLFQKRGIIKDGGTSTGIGEPSVFHALVVIFLEFFAWGLLTLPVINLLAQTFPTNKFLMNGLIQGVRGLLSFLSSPLIGALSDIWGRKFFLLLTVFVTCIPIPLLRLSPWWYFAIFSISGVCSVTFSVVLAYVADITEKEERNSAYGLVSATFGASLVISPALGAYISESYSDEAVVALATAIAALDVFFILLCVPESLPSKLRLSWDKVTWSDADPFAVPLMISINVIWFYNRCHFKSLKMVGEDNMIVCLCLIVFLSYLPEAGQFSCFFVYLKLVVGFSPEAVAAFIGVVGVLSVIAQTGVLAVLQRVFGPKNTILIGLMFQCCQLVWYGFGTEYWMMWAAGILVAISQVTYPSISSFVSINSDKDKQGTVQGVVTGIRGLCQGLGPAVFGFIFYLFNVDLNAQDDSIRAPFHKPGPGPHPIKHISAQFRGGQHAHVLSHSSNATAAAIIADINQRLIPGPPFVFGALLVFLAMLVVFWLPHSGPHGRLKRSSQTAAASAYECGPLLLPASSVLEEGSVTPPCVTASSPRFRTSTDSLDEFSSAEYRFGGTFSS